MEAERPEPAAQTIMRRIDREASVVGAGDFRLFAASPMLPVGAVDWHPTSRCTDFAGVLRIFLPFGKLSVDMLAALRFPRPGRRIG